MKTSVFAILCFALPPAAAQEHHDMHDMHAMHAGHDMGAMAAGGGQLGDYPMSRDASGTSWQPDATPMVGIHCRRTPAAC